MIGGLFLVALGAGITVLWLRDSHFGGGNLDRTASSGSASSAPAAKMPVGPSPVQSGPSLEFVASHAIAAVNANLRSDSSFKGKIIRVVSRGEKVQVLAEVEGFVQARLDNRTTGWIAKELLIPAADVERLKGFRRSSTSSNAPAKAARKRF